MHFRLDRYESPIGTILLVTDDEGALRALDFGDYEARMHCLLRRYYGDFELRPEPAPANIPHALDRYFAGQLDALDGLAVATAGTPFQRQVWRALREIPPRVACSYGQLAAQIGRPGASRAVGAANGSNPVAIVVPCHRVIGADGSLTGYGGGMIRKRWLLDHEAGQATMPVAAR
ncbi:MAG TPA: methylated-DNA--[protein]-cysteine S-methyltransferase [Pirellulales bacterium]|nr:methylated-DNA--[protein]-cysteine S-methyltransferase [Pirellulales bacterium]